MADTQKERKNRARIVERYKSRQPDRDWDDENASEDLAGFAADELEQFDADNKKLADLYRKDPRFAGLMNHAAQGGDILDYLLDAYGSDFAAALSDEAGRTKLSERKKKEAEDEAKRKADDEEQDRNYEQSDKNFQAIKDKYGLSDEELAAIYSDFSKMSRDVAYGLFDTAAMERYIKGGKYDKDVAGAREEGHIAGKNARARHELRESTGRKAGEIPSPEGSGAIARESKAQPKKATGMFGVTITSSGNGGATASVGGAE